ncbi:MAG: sensor histidine kinase [Roseiflexaceae bacterium]|nr:sensor histidine kinase [Roseiflexaceae bacterium]
MRADLTTIIQLEAENVRLRAQLQRTGAHLALLSDVNRQLSAAASLDQILDAAPLLPQRLVPSRAARIVLFDGARPIIARSTGDTLQFDGIAILTQPFHTHPSFDGAHLTIPLHDGHTLVGSIELLRDHSQALLDDELALLETIGGEIAEAISGARRRSQEAVAIHELEQAIGEERARIARDIHDGIAQSLAFRRMRIDLWLDWLTSDPERIRSELIQLKHVLRDQIADLRRAIFALRPIQFDELGFTTGLQRYVLEFAEQHGWQIDIALNDLPADLEADIEAACFRIVQEALTNAAKHAHPSAVTVTLRYAEGELLISVRDDGRGFATELHPEQQPGHVGLRQMRERLQLLGGRLELHSQPGAGTHVRAVIPRRVQSIDLSSQLRK